METIDNPLACICPDLAQSSHIPDILGRIKPPKISQIICELKDKSLWASRPQALKNTMDFATLDPM